MLIHVCKMYYAGARVGNYCVFEGFGRPPMAMLHFRSVDPYDLRCAMMRMRVCKMYYAGARVGNYCVFATFGGPPMAIIHFRPINPKDPKICDARAHM